MKRIFLFIFALFIASLGLAEPGLARTCSVSEAKADRPVITSVTKGPSPGQVQVSWSFSASSFCEWPVDFYQIRYTQGEGPATQTQTPQIPTNLEGGSYVMDLDNSELWGFVVQGCKSHFGSSSDCSAWSTMAYFKPYGPDMCRQPYVWRGGIPSDHVCVTVQTRDETAADNAAAASRMAPDKINCIQGFIWRGVVPSDHVCVTPQTWQQVQNDNASRAARVLP